jgi:hypothetical protein
MTQEGRVSTVWWRTLTGPYQSARGHPSRHDNLLGVLSILSLLLLLLLFLALEGRHVVVRVLPLVVITGATQAPTAQLGEVEVAAYDKPMLAISLLLGALSLSSANSLVHQVSLPSKRTQNLM